MAARMQQRRGTAAQWTSANPVLGSGEIGFETDSDRFKIGNGTSVWTALPYFSDADLIIDGAPETLNTLNKIAAAINDDPSFFSTISTELGNKQDKVADVSDTEIGYLNGVTSAIQTQLNNKAPLDSPELTGTPTAPTATAGTNTTQVATTAFVSTAVSNLIDSAPGALDTLNELAAAINDDASFASTVTTSIGTKVSKSGDTMTGLLTLSDHPTSNLHAATKEYVDSNVSSLQSTLEAADGIIAGSVNDLNLEVDTLTTDVGTITGAIIDDVDALSIQVQTISDNLDGLTTDTENNTSEITRISNELITEQGQLDNAILDIATKAPTESPTFTGTVELPTTTSIGDVSSAEIGHLNGVTSAIQDQIDDKLDSGIASSTYAPLNDPTFGGTVSLPNTTSIGNVSATEIGYLDGVTSSLQTQLTDLDTTKADIESPTFTGTVSGVTKSHVGLGNVDNTADADKPISTATQTALDAKLSLAGGTMTGKIILDGDPTQALHAVTKQYVDSVEAGLITRPAVKAATTSNLTGTYTNGTAGVNAQLNLGQLATLNIDGVTTWSQYNGILVKNQTNAFENGRYVVLQIGNDTDTDWILKRCPLCDEADEIPGSYIFVTDGSANEQTGWVQHVADPATFTVGTDSIFVYQFAGAGSVTAGTNVSVDGNQVSVIDAPVFTGIVDASAAGVEFSDGVQTKAGVPSLTTFVEKTADYTLDTLAHQDNIIEMNSSSPITFTIPKNANLAWPIGASMDIFQTGTGEVTIVPEEGGIVTLNRTPGNKLRTQWSSATILKRGTDSWILYGDLKA